MSPCHHPSEEALLAAAMGAIPPGAALTVRLHMVQCAHCRATLRFLNTVGGVILEEESPEGLQSGAVERAVAAIATVPIDHHIAPQPRTWDQVIADIRHGPWKPFLPGLEVADVEGPFEAGEIVCLLKCKAGSPVPSHTHEKMERFVVLKGGFGLDDIVYQPGDYIEADSSVTHTPFVPPEADCLCLFALEGGLIFTGPKASADSDR